MADQQASLARRARRRVALVPAETLRAETRAGNKLALRERPIRLLRIDLGVVQDAKFERVDPELLRHLVHGDLKRHQAWRLAGRAHRVPFGKIERGEPQRRHAVRARIEKPGLGDRVFGFAAVKIAGPALVADRGNLPVLACADADPLDRRRAMGRIVENRAGAEG